jgi:GNAT superfamily N-acetyltransferase
VSRRLQGYPPDVAVRTAEPGDVDSMFEIKRAASLAAYSHIFPLSEYPFPDEGVRDEVNAMMADTKSRALIAEKDGRAVGFIALIDAEVVSLFVVPEEWGQGIGTTLHDAAIRPLAESGRGSVQLWVLKEIGSRGASTSVSGGERTEGGGRRPIRRAAGDRVLA